MKKALLVIDVQNEYFTGKLPVTHPNFSFLNIIHAVDIANAHQLPVIFIQHTSLSEDAKTFVKGTHEWELHSKIKDKKHNYLVEKNHPGSFTGTNLDELLKQKECDTVVICGYMTHMCCDATARQAHHLGYEVEFLSDATGTVSVSNYAGKATAEELHRAALVTQASRFSRVMTLLEWEKTVK
jgi:nicotinamidase-related amidase